GHSDSGRILAAGTIVSRNGTRFGFKVLTHTGRLAALLFDKSPKRLALDDVNIEEVGIVDDPERADQGAPTDVQWSGVVARWAKLAPISGFKGPVSEKDRRQILASIRVPLPADYLDAINQAEGLQVGPVRILGLTSIGVSPLPDGEMLIIAKTPTGAI